MEEPDPQVVNAARGGDTRAFEELVQRYQGDVWRLCRHLLGDWAAADDATQEAFVRAFRFLGLDRGESKFSTWLFSIARNCARDELRRAGRRQRVAESATRDAERDLGRAPGDETVGVEVKEALLALPLELREPIVLIDLLGTSYKEVASLLGVPQGTIKSRVHRGREILASLLAPGPEEATREG